MVRRSEPGRSRARATRRLEGHPDAKYSGAGRLVRRRARRERARPRFGWRSAGADLAAAGANVTSFDNSDEQLALDRMVADREGLLLRTVQGDMADLSVFPDATFDLIFHPVANCFVPDLKPVWRECARVLKPGGRLLAGFMNPAFYLFDHDDAVRTGRLEVRYQLPYSDLTSITPEERAARVANNASIEFSHSLTEQIGGQLQSGLVIAGLYEDDWNDQVTPLNRFGPLYIATLARKL